MSSFHSSWIVLQMLCTQGCLSRKPLLFQACTSLSMVLRLAILKSSLQALPLGSGMVVSPYILQLKRQSRNTSLHGYPPPSVVVSSTPLLPFI
jgi:hypothetical protein